MRVAPPVHLSSEERTILHRWARGDSTHPRRAQRARIILAASGGATDLGIAEVEKVDRLTVAHWRRRFLAARLRGLDEARAPSLRSGRVPPEKIEAILRQARAPRWEGGLPSPSAASRDDSG